MTDEFEYRFKIDVFTPETLPMKRLAAYMAPLADLLGEEASVHFARLEPGSAVVVAKADPPAFPKIRGRVEAVGRGDAPRDAQQAYRRIDQMLAEDNAVGELTPPKGAGTVIPFPGRTRPQPVRYGPIIQPGALEGVLVRIGGVDETVPVVIQPEVEAKSFRCNATRKLAKQLAAHLFAWVRVHGEGRWQRTEDGDWELLRFNISEFEVLDESSLAEIASQLRSVEGNGWKEVTDPIEELWRIRRGGDDEVH